MQENFENKNRFSQDNQPVNVESTDFTINLFFLPTVRVRETSGNAELVLSGAEHEGIKDYQSAPVISIPHTPFNSNKYK